MFRGIVIFITHSLLITSSYDGNGYQAAYNMHQVPNVADLPMGMNWYQNKYGIQKQQYYKPYNPPAYNPPASYYTSPPQQHQRKIEKKKHRRDKARDGGRHRKHKKGKRHRKNKNNRRHHPQKQLRAIGPPMPQFQNNVPPWQNHMLMGHPVNPYTGMRKLQASNSNLGFSPNFLQQNAALAQSNDLEEGNDKEAIYQILRNELQVDPLLSTSGNGAWPNTQLPFLNVPTASNDDLLRFEIQSNLENPHHARFALPKDLFGSYDFRNESSPHLYRDQSSQEPDENMKSYNSTDVGVQTDDNITSTAVAGITSTSDMTDSGDDTADGIEGGGVEPQTENTSPAVGSFAGTSAVDTSAVGTSAVGSSDGQMGVPLIQPPGSAQSPPPRPPRPSIAALTAAGIPQGISPDA